MIKNIDDYLRLVDSENKEDNDRTTKEELSHELMFDIINHYPHKKSWLIHNKHIPIDFLKILALDDDIDVRLSVAMKNKNDAFVFSKLMKDKEFSVRLAVVRNKKLPIDLLKILINDSEQEISDEAKRILNMRENK